MLCLEFRFQDARLVSDPLPECTDEIFWYEFWHEVLPMVSETCSEHLTLAACGMGGQLQG